MSDKPRYIPTCGGPAPSAYQPAWRFQASPEPPASSLPGAKRDGPRRLTRQGPQRPPDFIDPRGQEWRSGYHGPR